MLITKETDYALRILRALAEGGRLSTAEVSAQQMVPHQFAYKIIKKLERAGLIWISRGMSGGCSLRVDLEQASLYDLIAAVEGRGAVSACMNADYECQWRKTHGGCIAHCQLGEIQQKLDEELKERNLRSLIFGVES